MPRRQFAPRLEALEDRCVPAALPVGFSEAAVATGLTAATAMQLAPDGKLYILEQAGTAEVWQNGTRLEANFFADTNLTPAAVDDRGERGLLGLAFDPDFATNRFVYVYYTVDGGASPSHNRLSRFTADAAGTRALANSEVALLDLANLSAATNHNGGALHFGGDGLLYVAVGDNANGALAQDLSSHFGKMLRLDVDDPDLVPADNPFVNTQGARPEIWALGLRNPYTFAVQPGTGRILVNDVGQSSWEEINDLARGGNYGWPGTEGPFNPASFPAFTNPLFAYPHPGVAPAPFTGQAVTGGAFHNAAAGLFPRDFEGGYYFADFVSGFIKRLDPATGQVKDFATGAGLPVDLKAAGDGALLYLSRQSGSVMRITFTGPRSGLLPDGSVGTVAERFVAGLYRTVLGRPLTLADQQSGVLAAHAALVNRIGTASFAAAFAALPESRAFQVRGLYQQLLRRAGEDAGVAGWVALMGRGVSYEQVQVAFLASAEYQGRFADTEALLRGIYLDVLRRPLDDVGRAFFLPRLQGGQLSVAQVAAFVITSPEGRGARVEGMFQAQLGRSAEPAARQAFGGLLLAGVAGEVVLGQIVSSAEYFAREVF